MTGYVCNRSLNRVQRCQIHRSHLNSAHQQRSDQTKQQRQQQKLMNSRVFLQQWISSRGACRQSVPSVAGTCLYLMDLAGTIRGSLKRDPERKRAPMVSKTGFVLKPVASTGPVWGERQRQTDERIGNFLLLIEKHVISLCHFHGSLCRLRYFEWIRYYCRAQCLLLLQYPFFQAHWGKEQVGFHSLCV